MGVNDSLRVAILGGGVAGLACAFRLRCIAPDARLTILDAGSRLGGKVDGDVVKGCIVDGGPDLCVGAKLERTHAFKALGLGSRLIPVNPDRLPTYRREGAALHLLPFVMTDGLVTFRRGMRDVVQLLAGALGGADIRTGVAARAIEQSKHGWRVITASGALLDADAVVVALPGPAAAAVLSGVAPHAGLVASRVKYAPMTTVSVGWAASDVVHDLGGTGYLVSGGTSGLVSACTWTSRKIPSRSPPDIVLMRGYARCTDAAAATDAVLADMREVAGITTDPLFVRAFAWSDAIPKYARDHSISVRALDEEIASLPRLALAGAAFHGVGVPDCIASGERAAESIAARILRVVA